MTTNYRQMLVCIDDDNEHVTFCELSKEGRMLDNPKDFADEGIWTEWSDWMSADRALDMITGFLEEK